MKSCRRTARSTGAVRCWWTSTARPGACPSCQAAATSATRSASSRRATSSPSSAQQDLDLRARRSRADPAQRVHAGRPAAALATPVDQRMQYEMTSYLAYRTARAPRDIAGAGAAFDDSRNPRTVALEPPMGTRQSRSARDPFEGARHFSQNYSYTLEPPPLDSQIPTTASSSTHARASASTTRLLRVADARGGHPARVVTGYQGGESIPSPMSSSVRQADGTRGRRSGERGRLGAIDPTAAVSPLGSRTASMRRWPHRHDSDIDRGRSDGLPLRPSAMRGRQ